MFLFNLVFAAQFVLTGAGLAALIHFAG
jgi:hypothetical protein